MRLSAELITSSPSYLNPLKERELDLRGHKIPGIENLGAAGSQDAIDFTDNDIVSLGNFPLSPRLQTLLCARNRISSIQLNLPKSIPDLVTLVLTENNLLELADLQTLAGFPKLTFLSLVDNPVASKENYRYYILHLAPQVRCLDFTRVRDAERRKARELFGTVAEPTDLAKEIAKSGKKKSNTFGSGAVVNGAPATKRVKLTDKERERFQALVKNAKTLAEVQRLEKDINEGRIPQGVMDDGMEMT